MEDRAVLILLDNCEHLIDASAALAVSLTSHCPGVRMLTTSREPLRVAGEMQFHVAPLGTPPAGEVDGRHLRASDAARLFSDRARAVQPSFSLSNSVAAPVAEICRRLDGIPLALELAATRLSSMTVEEIAAGLEQRFQLLGVGPRTAPPRHQSLLAMVDWSWALVDDHQRLLLPRLAVFAGGFTRDAAAMVASDQTLSATQVLSALDALVERSLIVLDDWRGTSRYRLLDTIRAFATDKLRQSDDEEAVRQRHQGWVFGLVEAASQDVPTDDLGWLKRMDQELENVRTALNWCRVEPQTAERALRASFGLWAYAEARGHEPELISRLEELLSLLAPRGATASRLLGQIFLAHALGSQGDVARALQACAAATALEAETDDPQALFWVRFLKVEFGILGGQWDGIRLALEAIEREAAQPSGFGPSFWLWILGEAYLAQGELVRARESLLAASTAMGSRRLVAIATRSLGIVEYRLGNLDEAEQRIRQSLEQLLPYADSRHFAISVEALGCIAATKGQWVRGARLLGAAEMLFRRVSTTTLPAWQLQPTESVQACQEQLGEMPFTAALEAGRAMSVDQALAEALRASPRPGDLRSTVSANQLTRREREVAQLVAHGLGNRDIAQALSIAEKTVEAHITRVLWKLGLESRAQLVVRMLSTETHSEPVSLPDIRGVN